MDDWTIQLQTAPLNRTILAAQENLTRMLDGLALLETESAKMSENWQGESYRQWKTEMESCLEEAGRMAEKLKRLISAIHQCALSLAQLEQNMAQEAKSR